MVHLFVMLLLEHLLFIISKNEKNKKQKTKPNCFSFTSLVQTKQVTSNLKELTCMLSITYTKVYWGKKGNYIY